MLVRAHQVGGAGARVVAARHQALGVDQHRQVTACHRRGADEQRLNRNRAGREGRQRGPLGVADARGRVDEQQALEAVAQLVQQPLNLTKLLKTEII